LTVLEIMIIILINYFDECRVWLASFQGFRFQAPNLKYILLEETN
jgi:hypothetical protein